MDKAQRRARHVEQRLAKLVKDYVRPAVQPMMERTNNEYTEEEVLDALRSDAVRQALEAVAEELDVVVPWKAAAAEALQEAAEEEESLLWTPNAGTPRIITPKEMP
jgi:hypothetical protein